MRSPAVPAFTVLSTFESVTALHTPVFGLLGLMGVPRPEEISHSIAIKLSTYCVHCSMLDSERETSKSLSFSPKKLKSEWRQNISV